MIAPGRATPKGGPYEGIFVVVDWTGARWERRFPNMESWAIGNRPSIFLGEQEC